MRDTFNESSNHEAFFVVCKVGEVVRVAPLEMRPLPFTVEGSP